MELLAGGGRGGAHRRVDFGLADVDAALGEALAQALGDDFVAQVVAEFGERHAVAGQALAQLVDGHAVLLGDALHRGLDVFLAGGDAGFGGARDLQAHQDQALQHLPLQHVRRRQLVFAAGVLGADVANGAVQFAAQDHVLVDHGGDPVHRLHAGVILCLHGTGEQQPGEGGGEQGTGEAQLADRHHGVVLVASRSGWDGWPVAVCGGTR